MINTVNLKELIHKESLDINQLSFGTVISIRGKTCLIVRKCELSQYPVLLVSLDNFKYYEEFESFNSLLDATSDIKIICKLTL